MAQVTKTALLTENAALKDQVLQLQQELAACKAVATPVPAAPTKRAAGPGAITPTNPLFAGLPHYVPHTKITCPVHREAQANKAGFCGACALARIRGQRAAA